MVVVFSCKLSASHAFFIHSKSSIEAKRGDVCGYEMAVYRACACAVIYHGILVSIFTFLELHYCEMYELN